MAIRRLFWDAGSNRDVHLLRGQTSRDLTSTGLRVVDENGDMPSAENYLLLTPNDHIVFTPRFKRASPPGTDYENADLGFRVNARTGAVTAALAHTRIKHNFVIEIRAQNQDGSTSTNTETIRVHVHNSVADLWLTPERLTVRPTGATRPEGTTSRFSLRVQFDTGVVGDLTDQHGVTWTSEGPGAADNLFADGKLRIASVDAPGSEIPIRATLPASLSGRRTDPATLRIGHAWADDPDPPEAEIVVGGAWPGVAQPDRVPNVLVLGDGFLDDDSDAFDRIVDQIVHHLKTNRLMRPYDLLTTSMNFWKAFQPSEVRGISFRCEVYTLLDGTQTWAVVLPALAQPPDSGDWSLEHLLYAAGLPVPFDATRPNDLIKADWDAVLDTSAWPSNVVSLIDDWKKLANRGFIEQLDGFPGMSFGSPPAADTADNTLLNLFEDRGGTTALRSFYRTLKADNGVTTEAGKPVGDLWATRDFNLYDFDNTDLVLLISSVNAGRAVNGTGYIAMSRGEHGYRIPVERVGDGRVGWRLDMTDSPDKLAAEQGRTAAHELGHSFGLGDEYVSKENNGIFPGTEASLATYANLQTEVDIRAGSGILIAGEIKWNWHRIRKAAVIDGDITVENGGFRVPLILGQASQFEEGDQVLLRARVKGSPLQKRQTTLSDGKLLKVVEALTDSSVVVEPVAAVPFDALKTEILGDYKKGSILFIPTPAPDSIRSAVIPFARMVATNIQGSIEGNNRPLTVDPCVFDDSDVQQPKLTGVNLPGVLCFKHKTRIIGLYSGGDEWSCGIFHPAGQCMMRDSDDADSEFCAVCRYILVDFINPFRHFEIDRDYAEIYPQD
jgi:hypothetical protein